MREREKDGRCALFSVLFHTNITVLRVPSVNIIEQQQQKALLLIAFLCADTVHIWSTHILHINTIAVPIPPLPPYIIIFIILHRWQIETLFSLQHDMVRCQTKQKACQYQRDKQY